MVDPQMQRVLTALRAGLFVDDSQEPDDVLPGLDRAVALGLANRHERGGLDTGTSFDLSRAGREALGIAPRASIVDRLLGWSRA